jgi:hypothetical protein
VFGPYGFHVEGEAPDIEVGEEEGEGEVEESFLPVSSGLEFPDHLDEVAYTA